MESRVEERMSTEVKLPELGENIDSGTVVKLLVAVGQKIEQGSTCTRAGNRQSND